MIYWHAKPSVGDNELYYAAHGEWGAAMRRASQDNDYLRLLPAVSGHPPPISPRRFLLSTGHAGLRGGSAGDAHFFRRWPAHHGLGANKLEPRKWRIVVKMIAQIEMPAFN